MRKNQITLLFALFFAVSCGVTGCGGGGGGSPAPQNPTLAGTWDVIELDTGSTPGWEKSSMTLDASGNISVNSFIASDGLTYSGPPLLMPIKLSIDSSRTVRSIDTSVTPNVLIPSFYGTLASNQRLFVATDDLSADTYMMMVARKRDTAVTYSNVDIRGKNFAFHQLNNGTPSIWEYGSGSIDAMGNVSIHSLTNPSGPDSGYPQSNVDNISVDSAGMVTNSDSTFYGMLAADKNTLFALITEPLSSNPQNRLIVIQFTGQVYSQVDLGGSWGFHTLFGNLTPGWLRGAFTVSSSTGGVTYASSAYISDFGPAVPPSPATETLTMNAAGRITNSLDPAFHGQMSSGKDLYVLTQSLYYPSATRYSMGLVLK